MEGFSAKIDAIREDAARIRANWLEETKKRTEAALNDIAKALAKSAGAKIEWKGFWSDSIEKALTEARCGYKTVKRKAYNPSSHDDYETFSHYEIWIKQ